MSEKELIIGFFEKGYCCDLDEVKDTCLGLLKENQELKEKYENAVAVYEKTMFENKELNKQLENANEQVNYLRRSIERKEERIIELQGERIPYTNEYVDKILNQQKEFIEYMNKTIEELECDDVDDEEMKAYLIQRIDTFKEILQKYKDIIGDDK